jgi:Flp pilus assembly protein TadD
LNFVFDIYGDGFPQMPPPAKGSCIRMMGEGHGREVAGALQTDAPAPAWSHGVTAVSAAANAAARDQTLRQATRLIALAVTMLNRGDARSAVAAASEACHRASHLPQAHYVYGQAWSALGDHARAEQAFAASLQLAPRWAEAWVNYGVARYRQGAIEDAKTAMRQALQSVPGHPAASANLGAFVRISGETEAAEILLRGTMAREPDNAAVDDRRGAETVHDASAPAAGISS